MSDIDHCVARTFRHGPPGTLSTSHFARCSNRPTFAVNGKPSCGSHIIQVLRTELEAALATGATSVPVCHWQDRK